MESFIKDNGIKQWGTGKEAKCGQMVVSMLASGKIIKQMAKVLCIILMVMFIKETG